MEKELQTVEPTFSELSHDFFEHLRLLVSAELGLMRTKLMIDAGRNFVAGLVIAVLGFFATAALFVGAVLGLAQLLDGRYWLSAIVVGALAFLCAALIGEAAFHSHKKGNIKDEIEN